MIAVGPLPDCYAEARLLSAIVEPGSAYSLATSAHDFLTHRSSKDQSR
jgi:hypothetical protein